MTRTSDDEWQIPPSLFPRHLTRLGQDEFARQIHDFIAGMDEQLRRNAADQRNDRDPEYTAADVRAARATLEEGPSTTDPYQRRKQLSLALQTVGSVGTPIMAAFLNSPWQIGLFAVFILAGLVGLALNVSHDARSRRRS